MKPKRIISLLLAICLVAGLMPTVAFATGSDKAIMLGTEHLQGAQADNIYFGNWTAPDKYTTSGPIKWRVLDDQTNFDSDGDGTNDAGLFLLSDGLLGTSTEGGVFFQQNSHLDGTYHKGSAPTDGNHTNCQIANAWQGSDAQKWCSTFYNERLTTQEQGAVLATTKSDEEFTSSTNKIEFAASDDILNGDKVFFLSAEEAETSSYGFRNADDRIAIYGSSVGFWWLRSPHTSVTNHAGLVTRFDDVSSGIVSTVWAARPAFNLDLNSVLFTSAAVGGKSSGAVDADALQPVSEYTGNEWKLTLLDSSRDSFAISNATMNGSGDTIAFSYSGAQTGTNEYISVVIENNGAITHYGRILQPESASGTASLTLPEGVTLGDTTELYVFNEQYNGDKMTDYASQLKEISSPTVDTTAPTLSNGSATRDSETTATVKFTSDEAGSYYYVVDNSETAPASIDTSGEGTSCKANEETEISIDSLSNGVQYIHIVVKDAVNNVSNVLTIQIPAYTFTVTVNVDPSNGGTASADPSAAVEGDEIELTASPNEGYHFKEWQITPNTVSIGDDNKFTMPAEDVTVKAAFEAHSFTQENTDNEYLVSPATCTQAATYYKSCSCGAKGTETFTSGEALGHTPGADWKHDNGSTHWKLCVSCNAKVEETAHVYDNEQDIICNACGYVKPTYAISASPETLDFGSEAEGYADAPAAQIVTITNIGNQSVTVNLPTSATYTITAGTGFKNGTATLASDGTATFTVQPKTGLTAGSHSETLTISGSGNASVQVALSFTVNTGGTSGGSTGGSTTDYYRLTFDVNGGSEIASILRAEYTTVDLSDYKPTREGYEFTGWYADEDLTDKITSIRLTRNTTVYAGWEEKKENPGTGFENPFTDISENDWFYEDVMFVFANDLMVGTGDATFSPEISTSRAMIVVTLWRMEGEPAAKGANPYTDVENGAWYTEAITWANENGIAEGYGNGCFQPETPVTREQLAAFFYRYAAYKGYDITITGSLDHFNDKDNVSEWAKDTMAWAVGYGLIGGKDNNMLDPQGEATRAEFAAMLQRFCQKG